MIRRISKFWFLDSDLLDVLLLIPARVEINRQRKSIFTMIRFKVIAVPPNIFFSLEIMRKSGKKTEFRINRMVPEK